MRDFTTAGCDHSKRTYEPEYDHVPCDVCGAVKTDMQWGIASDAWFDNLAAANFYRDHGRLPDAATAKAKGE